MEDKKKVLSPEEFDVNRARKLKKKLKADLLKDFDFEIRVDQFWRLSHDVVFLIFKKPFPDLFDIHSANFILELAFVVNRTFPIDKVQIVIEAKNDNPNP